MVVLTGTEKQITYAESVRTQLMERFHAQMATMAGDIQHDPEYATQHNYPSRLAAVREFVEFLSTVTAASEWLDFRTSIEMALRSEDYATVVTLIESWRNQ